jgi:hypothetical protein
MIFMDARLTRFDMPFQTRHCERSAAIQYPWIAALRSQ